MWRRSRMILLNLIRTHWTCVPEAAGLTPLPWLLLSYQVSLYSNETLQNAFNGRPFYWINNCHPWDKAPYFSLSSRGPDPGILLGHRTPQEGPHDCSTYRHKMHQDNCSLLPQAADTCRFWIESGCKSCLTPAYRLPNCPRSTTCRSLVTETESPGSEPE